MIYKDLILYIALLSNLIPFFQGHATYKLNKFFFFDPITETPCNESNYWTPYDQSTTCYRFVSITKTDSDKKEKIKIMLDHNIATSSYIDYKKTLKEKTSKWSRYKGVIDIIDEGTIFNLMQYSSKPTTKDPSSPPYKIGNFYSNSYYINNGKKVNEKGYWTKTIQNGNLVYAIDANGKNIITSMNTILGIRPVIEIEKTLLKTDSGLIDISNIIKKAKKIEFKYENKKYDGNIYKQLQGFTVTKDKLIFMSSNNNNRAKSVLYSYKLNDLKTLYKKDYSTTGHGNGMTYNSKTNKVLVVGPYEYDKVYLYNGDTLVKEKEYPKENYPTYSAIGYDDINDFYIGHAGRRLFMADTTKMQKLNEFDISTFETGQDLEYHDGYVFYCTTEAGPNTKYQTYSFYKKSDNIIYVYDMKLDGNKKTTKNFGRLVARLHTTGIGKMEMESVSFSDGYIYFGFASHEGSEYTYVFYKLEYKLFKKEVKKLS